MVPTRRLALLASAGLLPAVLAIAWPAFAWVALGWSLLTALLAAVDLGRCPPARQLEARRVVEEVVSAGAPNRARLEVENLAGRAVEGEIADEPPPGAAAEGWRKPFHAAPQSRWVGSYLFNPAARGDHDFGDLHLRLLGPWGLAARQHRVPAARRVKAYPDLEALSRDALALTRPHAETGLARLRRSLGEGRDFESLREYLPGDDVRVLDWKATARRQKPIARQYEPERNQTVVLLLDCGRHMVSRLGERTKLDFAIDAALRLARVSLDRGDQVGLCAFGSRVHAWLPPKKGRPHLKAMVELLYPLQPELVESDYGGAFALVGARLKRRSLVVTFTDLLDEDSSRALLGCTLQLRPRHLPLVVAAADGALVGAARAVPASPEAAYARVAARRIVAERERTVARLSDAGAQVVDAVASELSAAVVNRYLEIKGRGAL